MTQDNKLTFLRMIMDLFTMIMFSVFTGAGIFFFTFIITRNILFSYAYSSVGTALFSMYIFCLYLGYLSFNKLKGEKDARQR